MSDNSLNGLLGPLPIELLVRVMEWVLLKPATSIFDLIIDRPTLKTWVRVCKLWSVISREESLWRRVLQAYRPTCYTPVKIPVHPRLEFIRHQSKLYRESKYENVTFRVYLDGRTRGPGNYESLERSIGPIKNQVAIPALQSLMENDINDWLNKPLFEDITVRTVLQTPVVDLCCCSPRIAILTEFWILIIGELVNDEVAPVLRFARLSEPGKIIGLGYMSTVAITQSNKAYGISLMDNENLQINLQVKLMPIPLKDPKSFSMRLEAVPNNPEQKQSIIQVEEIKLSEAEICAFCEQ